MNRLGEVRLLQLRHAKDQLLQKRLPVCKRDSFRRCAVKFQKGDGGAGKERDTSISMPMLRACKAAVSGCDNSLINSGGEQQATRPSLLMNQLIVQLQLLTLYPKADQAFAMWDAKKLIFKGKMHPAGFL